MDRDAVEVYNPRDEHARKKNEASIILYRSRLVSERIYYKVKRTPFQHFHSNINLFN